MSYDPPISTALALELREWVQPDAVMCSQSVHRGCTEEALNYIQYRHVCNGAHITVYPVCRGIIHAIGQAVIDQAIITCPSCQCGIPAREYRVAIGKVTA